MAGRPPLSQAAILDRFRARTRPADHEVRVGIGPCLIWIGHTTPAGYGEFYAGLKRSRVYAHVFAYEIEHGRCPTLCVLHRCDVRPCVSGDHLFEGTRGENAADRQTKGRTARGEQQSIVLREADIRDMLTRFAGGESLQQLVRSYPLVSDSAIRAILRGATWAHVEGPRLPIAEIVARGKQARAAGRWAARSCTRFEPMDL